MRRDALGRPAGEFKAAPDSALQKAVESLRQSLKKT
jgi:hypothetical protein